MTKLKDITGEVFSMLSVIRQCEPPPGAKRSGSYWLCVCECGNEVRRRGTDLRKPRKFQSCGCRRKPMLKLAPGVDLGGLVIVEKAEGGSTKHPRWLCRCRLCNETKPFWSSALHQSPNRKDCGCGRRRRFKGGQQAPDRFYEPGICPNLATCGPCQQAGRSSCFYGPAQIAAFRLDYPPGE